MGYCMHQSDSSVRIRARDFPAALRHLRPFYRKRNLPWPWPYDLPAAEVLREVLHRWNWDMEQEEGTGDMTDLLFTGEKLHDDDQLFAAMAPVVECGSYIQMVGDDDYHWRWVFTGRRVVEHGGGLVFPPLPGERRRPKPKVIVHVRGGVAYLHRRPRGVRVEIVDFDDRDEAA